MGWPDHYTKRAHKEGYAARSVYKLQEVEEKFKLFSSGDSVLDLGCFPGSFCQYAASRAGAKGKIIGFDMQKVPRSLGNNISTFVVDVTSEDAMKLAQHHGPYDVILSDMAPSTTGNRALDQSRSAALMERAWEFALVCGKPGAKVLIKFFQGAGSTQFLNDLKKQGIKSQCYKPKASRAESYEQYVYMVVPSNK